MYKIYSRKRFLIKSKFQNPIIKIILVVLIVIAICELILNKLEPVFESLCREEAKTMAILITNQQSTIVMNNYQYEELYTIEKDSSGTISVIKANVIPINNLMSDVAEKVQQEFKNMGKEYIKIPVGNLTNSYIFSGMGPDIPVQVSILGNVETEVKSEFISQGINQTIHRLYMVVTCKMQLVTPVKNIEEEVVNQIIIAEHVIIGKIPDAYYNLEGINEQNSLDVIH